MIEKILQKAKEVADQAEVFEVISEDSPVSFEDNKLKSVLTRSVKSYALRIIKNGRVGFSSSSKPDAADELVTNALATAEFGQQVGFQFPSQPSSIPGVKVFDKAVKDLSIEKMVETGQKALDEIRTAEPDAQVSIGLSRSYNTIRIMNTSGLDMSYTMSHYSFGGGLELIRGTDMLQVWEGNSARNLIDSKEIVKTIIDKTNLGKNVVPIDSKPMPVIFTPKGFSGALEDPLTMAFSGKEVLQGATPVSDKLGQQMLDPRISVYDDGTQDYASGSRPLDDEGVVVDRNPLIDKGVIKNFIYDLETAWKAGTKPTGNGDRGGNLVPMMGYNSIVIDPGDTPLEEMIKGVKYGLLVDQFLGAWAGNLRSGEVSANVHYGLKIENGEFVGRVKDVMIACNVFDIMKNVESIENKSHWEGGLKAPHMLFPNISVSSQQ